MRTLIRLACIVSTSLWLHGCGGDTSVALFIHWGDCDFDRARWAQADRAGRGCMLASFLEQHPPATLTASELRWWLGEPTGYRGDNEDPAYLVAPPDRTGERLLVFVTDKRSGQVLGAELLRP